VVLRGQLPNQAEDDREHAVAQRNEFTDFAFRGEFHEANQVQMRLKLRGGPQGDPEAS